MAGKHSAPNDKISKTPIIILSVAAVVVIAAVIGLIIFLNGGKAPKNSDTAAPSTANFVASDILQTESENQTATNAQEQSSQGLQEPDNDSQADSDGNGAAEIVVPTKGGTVKSSFNSTYVPYSATDSETGEEISLKEVFGSQYTDGVITFNSDGTFTDTLTNSPDYTGAYLVEDDDITMTYTNDKNFFMTVNEWDGDEPADITGHYGDIDVRFYN